MTYLGKGTIDLGQQCRDDKLHALTGVVGAFMCDQDLPLPKSVGHFPPRW
jgi:hypothetical protein